MRVIEYKPKPERRDSAVKLKKGKHVWGGGIKGVTLYDELAGRPLVLGLEHVLCLVVVGRRSDQQNVHVSFLNHIVFVVALQLLRTFQPAETLWRSRQLHLKPGLVLLIHLNVTQRCEEVQRKF